MENANSSVIAKSLYQLQYIAFVSPSEKERTDQFVSTPNSSNGITGQEASQFYNEIISAPSASNQPSRNINKPNKRKVSAKTYNVQNSRFTIFHYAQDGNIEGLKYLLSSKCEINQQDMYGWTALMCATYEGHCHAVEYLLKCGADVSIKNKQGFSALDLAIQKNNFRLLELLKDGFKESRKEVAIEEISDPKFCAMCNYSYKETTAVHEKSIAHLFCDERKESSTFYHIPENNKGFQIMLKSGWDKNRGLGSHSDGRKFPIKTILKRDRTCIGSKKEVSHITHFNSYDYNSVKKNHQPSLNLIKEKTFKKRQREKFINKLKQKEINFRREFLSDF